jgi:hypothetical protein
MKMKCVLCVALIVLISGCFDKGQPTGREGVEDMNKDNGNNILEELPDNNGSVENTSRRSFIELEYVGSVENTWAREIYGDLTPSGAYYYFDNTTFTWWSPWIIPVESTISEYFGLNTPTEIDRTEKDLVISFGRKLRYLYYEGLDHHGYSYLAHPVFEREHHENSVHIYLIDRIPLAENEWATTDMSDFNQMGNIPYELPPED